MLIVFILFVYIKVIYKGSYNIYTISLYIKLIRKWPYILKLGQTRSDLKSINGT